MLKIYIYWHKCWCYRCGTGRDGQQVKIELLSFWSVNRWVSQCLPVPAVPQRYESKDLTTTCLWPPSLQFACASQPGETILHWVELEIEKKTMSLCSDKRDILDLVKLSYIIVRTGIGTGQIQVTHKFFGEQTWPFQNLPKLRTLMLNQLLGQRYKLKPKKT